MRILLAVHHFPPRHTGGAEWQAFRTAKALAARGHEVRVICVESITDPSSGGLKADLDEYDGISVERLTFDLAGCPDPFQWSYDNPLIGEYIDRRIVDYRPDAFHLIGGYLISGRPLLVAREREIPTYVTLTDYWFLCPRTTMVRSDGELATLPTSAGRCGRCIAEQRRRFRWPATVAPGLMERYWEINHSYADNVRRRQAFLIPALSAVNAIISPSRFLRSMYVQSGIPVGKFVYSRQGIPRVPPVDGPNRRDASRRGIYFGYVGQITRIKGVHILLEAVMKVRDDRLRVLIYGNTKEFPDYVRRLKAMVAGDKRIRFAGLVSPAELSRVYSDLDALVVPSVNYENSPNVILEAQSHALPVIASNLGGMAEMVRPDVDGLLFPPGDADGLAQQIERVIQDPGLLRSFRRAAPVVKTLDEEMDELLEIYNSVKPQKSPTFHD